MNLFQKLRWWVIFGLGLITAIAGWMWIMVRLVHSESEAADARVREAEERLLMLEASGLEEAVAKVLDTRRSIPELARSGDYMGWWQAVSDETRRGLTPDRKVVIGRWQQKVRDRQAGPADLQRALDEGELQWGWLEDGRDPVAAFLTSMYRQGERSPELSELLADRVWSYESPAVRPAFRLTLIRPLLDLQPSEELRRLLEIETIRASSGRIEELGGDYERIETRWDGAEVTTFWTQAQLLGLLDSPGNYRLFPRSPEDRAAVTVRGLERWPFLAADSALSSAAVDAGNRSLIWIGALSGLSLVAITIGAVFFGRHQLRLARLRTDLAASVAHELRTPLAGQRLLLETLIETPDSPPQQREEYLAMAFRENKRLSRLAEEFLTFSRLERGVLQLDIESVDVAEVIDGAVESLREKWDDPECELAITIDESLPKLAADRQALITVLRNLLENAWKYSNKPRVISVRASEAAEGVAIAVTDNGIGLSAAERQRIFRQFYQVDQRLSRTQQGLGLGLSIVKRLLESMDGTIAVESPSSGGSRFIIHIPKAP